MVRVELRQFPDIIVATPGRILDHLRNTQSFSLEDLEILVMDEADRLLDMGFTEEVEEIVKQVPKGIHNMLFSATMTEEVRCYCLTHDFISFENERIIFGLFLFRRMTEFF